MVTFTDVLTNRQWIYPDSATGMAIYMGIFPPGRYDIRNGSTAVVAVKVTDVSPVVLIPIGATWNIATQENDRSRLPCPDYAVWMHSGRFN